MLAQPRMVIHHVVLDSCALVLKAPWVFITTISNLHVPLVSTEQVFPRIKALCTPDTSAISIIKSCTIIYPEVLVDS